MMDLTPVTLREARAFVGQHHRHHRPPQGGLFAVGLAVGDNMIGVLIVGKPVARMLADDYTAEVTRVAVIESAPKGANSKLYGAAWRACRALGYRRLITYTLPEEGGASLRGAGWRCVGEAGGGSWSRKSRPRVDTHPMQKKIKWEKNK